MAVDESRDWSSAMNGPLVSIVIPTYNYAHLIVETLISIVKQTYQSWECIIVDDGSTDDTKVIVTTFINENATYDFKYIQKKNEGTSAAKNDGIKLARGRYIQFLDADDLLSTTKLATQVSLLEAGDMDLVFSKSIFFMDTEVEKTIIQKYPTGFLAEQTLKGQELLRSLITNNIVTISSPLIKKDVVTAVGMFNTSLTNNEDWLFWFRVAMRSSNFVFDDNEQSFTQIRIHQQSAMNIHSKMFDGEVVVRHQMDIDLLGVDDSEDTKRLRKLNLDLLALHRVRSLDTALGMKYILTNFVKNPIKEFSLLTKAFYKLGVRMYKSQ